MEGLALYGAEVVPNSFHNVGAFDYIVTFIPARDVRVTVCLSIADWQTESDVVITNMTTLPVEECGKGYGSRVIEIIIRWATVNHFNEIEAVQVSNPNAERFWERNGFEKLPEPNPIGNYVRYLNH